MFVTNTWLDFIYNHVNDQYVFTHSLDSISVNMKSLNCTRAFTADHVDNMC